MVQRRLNLPKLLGKKSSAFVFGARGVGKTKLAQVYMSECDGEVWSLDLLAFELYQRYLREPHIIRKEIDRRMLQNSRLTVFIDEIQKVPALLDEIHALIETYKGRLQFLLTGSSARKLKRDGANLLAGRALTARLHPLCSLELDLDLERTLRLGSLPGIVLDHEAPELALKSYVETYLKEEIFQEAIVRKADAFSRFLEVAGQYHGATINATEIGKAAGVSSHTVLEYFQILEDTLLGWRLPGWNASTKKQLRTTPRFLFFDNGVANALRGELSIALSPRTGRYGQLFETWIIQEAFRYNDYLQLDLKFSYWRTNNDQEVDLIVSRGAGPPLAAIEIKSGTAPTGKHIRGLKGFASEFPHAKLFCFCQTTAAYREDEIDVVHWKEGLDMLSSI